MAKQARGRARAKAPAGNVTVKAPRLPKKFKSGPSALADPRGGEFVSFGRMPYRNAGADFWTAGGNILYRPAAASANRDILAYRDRGVANAREADRNNALINSGISTRAVNTVGAALRLQYMPNWARLGIDPSDPRAVQFVADVENHFSLWGEDFRLLCDAQRQGQFGAMMLLACRECFGTEGETLVIVRYDEERMNRYRGDYATFLEVVTCDRLSTPSDYVPRPGQPEIVSGKELDEYGAAVAFHVETKHRDDDKTGERKWARIVRETEWGRPVGVHFFFRHRAGMQRNMPAIIQSLRSIKMLDKFDDMELEAAVVATLVSIFIESQATSEEMLQKLSTTTPAGGTNVLAELWDKRFDLYEELQLSADGVRIPVLPPGDKINIQSTNRANNDTKTFRSAFQRGMARQLNLTYEQFSGDYSETTFSSARAALIDTWRLVTADRILFTQHVPHQCFAAFVEELFVRGDEVGFEWPADFPDFYENMTAYTQCEFRGPGMGWVDPDKDQKAAAGRQEQALTSPTFEAAQQGQDFRDNVDQIARDHAYARSKGVFVPGMPEYVAMQNPVQPAADEETPDKGDDREPPRDSGEAAARELEDQENRR